MLNNRMQGANEEHFSGISKSINSGGQAQQLVARIKRSSKYYGQTEPGIWFMVDVVEDTYYQLRGNNNNYRVCDVVMGLRLSNGSVLDLTTSKTIAHPSVEVAR